VNLFNNKYVLVILMIILLIAGTGVLSFLNVEITLFNVIERGIYNILSPVINMFNSMFRSVNNYFRAIFNINHLLQENRYLQQEVLHLQRQIHYLEEEINQEKRLENLQSFMDAFKDFTEYQVTGASVIGFAPGNFEDILLINRGARHGLETKMPVISYNGLLVGQISYVGASTSQVTTVNNSQFAVGAIVQRSRAIGLVSGKAGDNSVILMENIDAEADVQEGDQILTSGLSEHYPRYLPIGRIKQVELDNFGLSKTAQIELFLNRYTVEEVLVITEF